MKKMPIDIFSLEHGVIQNMIKILKKSLNKLNKIEEKKSDFLNIVIDFFRTFANDAHHGKEEDIFFMQLKKKPLIAEEKKLLKELLEEHKKGRILINKLEQNKSANNFSQMEGILKQIIDLYTQHIEKENVRFFPATFKYFSNEEKTQMVLKFNEIDQKVLHVKYDSIVKELFNFF